MSQTKVSNEIALSEFTKFLQKHKSRELKRGKLTQDKIQEDYIDAIEAIEEGALIFENGKPIFMLRDVISPPDGEDQSLAISKLEFRSRIKPSDKAKLMEGLNPEKQSATFTLRYLAYIIKQPLPVLDKLSQDDYNAVNQVCSVF